MPMTTRLSCEAYLLVRSNGPGEPNYSYDYAVGAKYDRSLPELVFTSASQPDSVHPQSTHDVGTTNLFYDANGNMTSDRCHSYLGCSERLRKSTMVLSQVLVRLFRRRRTRLVRNTHLILV